jgi:hypothetical protein
VGKRDAYMLPIMTVHPKAAALLVSLATLMAVQLVHMGPPTKAPLIAKKTATYLAVVFFVARKIANPVPIIGAAMHKKSPRFLMRMEMYGNYSK